MEMAHGSNLRVRPDFCYRSAGDEDVNVSKRRANTHAGRISSILEELGNDPP